MISSECVPFAKSGGLADVVAALSRQLSSMGHDVRIILPEYSFLNLEETKITVEKLIVPMGIKDETVKISETNLPGSKLKVVFVGHSVFTNRTGIYGEHGSHSYRDNYYRFALFSASAFSYSHAENWIPDIIHSHDWPAGLVPAYLNNFKTKNLFNQTESIFTIHNTGYQGNFSKYDILPTGLSWNGVSSKKAKYIDEINFLQSGIVNSKAVTTVSPSYADEIKIPGKGHGLEQILINKNEYFLGILNGVDYTEWDPEHDSFLDLNFSYKNLKNKWKLKELLQNKSQLPVNSKTALIGMVGRLADQKGFSELCKINNNNTTAIEQICNNSDVQMIILGTGEKWIEEELKKLSNKLPNLKVFLEFDNGLAHLIEAGTDFFLMPSKYEPCGLNQIYSLKYGSVPIVRATGGLKDTVIDYFKNENTGTGFHIPGMNSGSIVETVRNVLDLWRNNKNIIERIRKTGMLKEFLWEDSATQYEKLYKKCLNPEFSDSEPIFH